MNRNIYRLVRSQTGLWVPAPEHTRSNGKGGKARKALLATAAAASLFSVNVSAENYAGLPDPCSTCAGGSRFVESGAATYNPNGNFATVSQFTDKAILNWQDFNLAQGNQVLFQRLNDNMQAIDGASFSTLNRIWDADPTVIAGQISTLANQKANLMFINQNGILFANGAQINIAQFTASALNIKNSDFLNNAFAPQPGTSNNNPVFQYGLDGKENNYGFVKVLEGAKISSSEGGRVMLIAPTVTNRGDISTPNGQAILAAGSAVYLATSSNPSSLRGLLVQVDNKTLLDQPNAAASKAGADAYDQLGSATNVGSITANKGNITMVGLGVNQMGRATATSAYNFNGSIYLRAMSNPQLDSVSQAMLAKVAGRAVLGSNSLTQVTVDTSDTTKNSIAFTPSTVSVIGNDIQVKSGAKVVVPAGIINLSAVSDPSKLLELNPKSTTDPFATSTGVSEGSRVLVESGALLDVSGLDATESQKDNVLAIKLLGAELANSPSNRERLRGKTVYVDVTKGSPLIANLAEYKANIAKTLQQRSTNAGSIRMQSEGQTIVQSGATLDLSGGVTTYQEEVVPTTALIGADGRRYDISEAKADITYVGLANEFTIDEGWGQNRVISWVDQIYNPSYLNGGNAGLFLLNARTSYFDGNFLANTTAGVNQLQSGHLPLSAAFMLGFNKPATGGVNEFGLNQNVLIDGNIAKLSADGTLTEDQANNLHLSSAMFGKNKIGRLEINTNKNVTINQSLKMADGGSVNINAAKVNVNADITTTKANVALNQYTIEKPAPSVADTNKNVMNADLQTASGAINIKATNNQINVNDSIQSKAKLNTPEVIVVDNVKLTSTGAWVNERVDLTTANNTARLLDGGSISLTAAFYDTEGKLIDSKVQLGTGALLDVRGGAYLDSFGEAHYGKGGDISLYATDIATKDALQSHFKGESFGDAGKVSVTSDRVLIGAISANALSIDSGFFNQGFASYAVTGLSGLEVAENTNIKVQTNNLLLNERSTTTGNASNVDAVATKVLLDESLRKTADLSLNATTRSAKVNDDNESTQLSDLKIGKGAQIVTDIGANVTINATNSIDIDGTIKAPAGKITVTLDNEHNANAKFVNSNAQRIHLGENAVLAAVGAAKLVRDRFGLNQGVVLKGGEITLNAKDGYVDTEKNALIDVSGAAPVDINIANVNGGQGQAFASDAGTVTIKGLNGLYLDNTFDAKAGSAANRGGVVNVQLGITDNAVGYDKTLHVGQYDAVSPSNSAFRNSAQLNQGYVDPTELQNAGFETINLTSRDTIQLEQGASFGATQPLYSVQLNTSNIVSTVNGDTDIKAKLVALGNDNINRQTANNALTSGTGKLNVNADYIALNGNASYSGFSDVNLNSTGEVRLIGVQPVGDINGAGKLNTLANVNITANLVDPSSLTTFEINTNGTGDVRFSFAPRTSDILAYSAQGKLKVDAKNIVQAGRIVAPFGDISLKAAGSVTLESGSVTSVAAAPGQIIPFGYTLNGTTWFFDRNGDGRANFNASDNEVVKTLFAKKITLDSKQVDIKNGATVDISAAGELQASQFTQGTQGTTDFLAEKDYYAILPEYNGTVAPTDVLRDAAANQPLVGSSIYLSEGNGVAAGNYVLLPAKYTLLPGAMAVKVSSGVSDVLPNSNYLKSDGVAVIGGFLSDQRFSLTDTNTARWTGFEVMTKNQVLDRAQYSLLNASNYFANNTDSAKTLDAGLLQIKVEKALAINGNLKTNAAAGGVGAALDISADKLAVLSASAKASAQADEVVLDIEQLNKLNIDSLLLGATRERSGSTTTLAVSSQQVRMDNVAGNGEATLQGREIMLAAKNDVKLQNNATIKAAGNQGDAGTYVIKGDAAFVRAAATDAKLSHGDTNKLTGNIAADAGVSVLANQSVMLDATKDNLYNGKFNNGAFALPKNLLLSAGAMLVGDAPKGVSGFKLSGDFLNGLAGVDSLTLRSYSSVDFYGNANLGTSQVNSGTRNYAVNNLTLEAADIRGYGVNGNTANIQAKTLTFANPDAVANGVAGTGKGVLNVQADTLYLGAGTKAINGFGNVNITSSEILSSGKAGELKLDANTQINTARLSGENSTSQKITSTADLNIDTLVGALASRDTFANSWAIQAKNLKVDTAIQAISGDISLTATGGNLTLGQNVKLNASGKLYKFYDKSTPIDAGRVSLKSDTGNITASTGAQINLDAAAGGNAGQLNVQAANGEANISSASLTAKNVADSKGVLGKSGAVAVDAKTINNFDQLNQQLNQGGFAEKRDFRLRSGDLSLTQTGTGGIQAHEVQIAVDNGKLSVDNTINASGAEGGKITLFARDDVKLTSNANLNASATKAGENGGKVTIGTGDNGTLDLQGGQINVANSQGGDSGEVLLRAPRTNNSVAVKSVNTDIQGASSVVLEGVKVYENISTFNQTVANTILADNTAFMGNKTAITNGLGAEVASLGNKFHLRGGAEVRSAGNMTVSQDVSLYQPNRPSGEPGTLTLRANGDLTFNGSLSDGFTTAATTGLIDPNKQESWSYRLVSGADQSGANPLALIAPTKDADGSNKGDFTLAAGKLIRTGTGDIDIAAAGNLNLNDQASVIYTAGRVADGVSGFNYIPNAASASAANPTANSFTQNGGDVSLNVLGNINGAVTTQLYSSWLYRQGRTNAAGNFDATNPQTAWWVQFSQFQQGIATLGGGNVNVNAGGNINNLSASAATNGRMGASTPTADKLVVLGGGDVNITAEGDIKGGQYYAAKGKLNMETNGGVVAGTNRGLYTTIALGDGQATIKAKEDINIQAVINPTMVMQSSGAANLVEGNIVGSGSRDNKLSNFSTYTDKTEISYESLNGGVTLHNNVENLIAANRFRGITWSGADGNLNKPSLEIAPGGLKAYAYNGDVIVNGLMRLYPASSGAFELLAKDNVNINANITQSDAPLSTLSDARGNVVNLSIKNLRNDKYIAPGKTFHDNHASTPVHAKDTESALIYALEGNVQNLSNAKQELQLAKSAKIKAGQDYKNLSLDAQNLSKDDVTSIKTGRDIVFDTDAITGTSGLNLGGQGLFELEAGRNIDLGASRGINSIGNSKNPNLPVQGADINVAVGVPNGVDYAGAIERLLNAIQIAKAAGTTVDENTLWQARWLTGNETLANNAATLQSAVQAIKDSGQASVRESVRNMFYTALRETGRDFNNADSDFAGQYGRGYSAIELLFPNISEKNADGSSKFYAGDLTLPLTTIKTSSGGDVEFMVPGGKALVGYTNIEDQVLGAYDKSYATIGEESIPRKTIDTGIVAVSNGSVRGFTLGDILVNQSRILTVAGGDIMLWSSEGNIDAGKGKRTAVVVPPPLVYVDTSGNLVVSLQGAATGSGIGALGDENTAGNVDLIAPKGSVDAGDAGIRAKNINIAANLVLNAGNINASGSATGTQVAVAGALNGSITGASNAGDPNKAVNDAVKQAVKEPAEPFKKPVSPSFINVEVVSIGQ